MKAILTYHSIDDSGSVISIDQRTFMAHARWLAANVAVVPLAELRTTEHQHAVAITFDDGFQNFADAALPVLREHALPATVFVATGCVGLTNEWAIGAKPTVPQLPLMNWDTLGRITDHDITIGSHTRTHPDLRQVRGERLQAEIVGAAVEIARRLGTRPAALAYPYGEYDDAALAMARSRYQLACTTELRTLHQNDDALQLPRLDAYYFRRPGLLEQFGSQAFRRFIWVRRHGRAVRRVLTHAGAHL
jgi:peptidoglycan/xylan/chitin deacetylase (PgdA/CDA1 family)